MLTIALISVVSVSPSVAIELFNNKRQSIQEFFVGVEFAYGDVGDLKDLVDKVKNYTNLVVIGSPEISFNQNLLNETCDYIHDAELYFIVMVTGPSKYNNDLSVWIMNAEEKYGDRFLGVYRLDEPGGNQLDDGKTKFVSEAKNYTDAAET